MEGHRNSKGEADLKVWGLLAFPKGWGDSHLKNPPWRGMDIFWNKRNASLDY